ncbi:MAG: SMP-30/gluconolactonase/LRE family protein [Vicinamibacteria bacterium]|jgi:sugar lactone lactonase YvrE
MLAAGALAALAVLAPSAGSETRTRFDTDVFALIPTPGFPARAYVAPNHRVYEGTYTNPNGDTIPSLVREYSRTGTLLRSWTIAGQDLAAEHGVQVATSDSRGRLVLLDKAPARVLLLNPRSGKQRPYATFPSEALPNYAAWGRRGELYVTDYTHATIWRVPPGGGEATAWLSDPRLNGLEFGTTGIVLTADRSHLLVGQQSSAGLGGGNPATGKIYEVEIAAGGSAGAIRTIWESAPLDAPDGFAVDSAGRIYVALLLSNQIAVIAPGGTELERFPTSAGGGENGSAVPFDNPSSAMFLGRRLLIANQSYLAADPSHQAILDLWIGVRGAKERIPRRAGLKPR